MNQFLAARLHWRLGVVIAITMTALVGGLALAHGPALEQTARVAVACAKTSLVKSHSAGPGEVYVVAPGRARVASRPALTQHRKPCGHGTPRRGLSKRVALGGPPGQQAPAPGGSPSAPRGETTLVVTSRSPVAVAPPPAPADTTPPQTSIASGPPATTTSTTAKFVFSSSELGSSFECNLDGAGWAPCATPEAYAAVAVGPHQLSVRAVDTAENADATPATRSWTVEELIGPPPPPDTTPPQTSISGGPATATTSTSATFAFASSEAGSSFECNLDGAGWGVCTSPSAYSGFTIGPHQFSVRAIDAALNVDPTPATSSWTVEEPLPPPPPPPPPAECSTAVSSVSAAESAVAGAAAGSVVCLADGSYGEVTLSASKSAQVTLQAEHPGRATIDGASLDGSHLTLARFDVTNEVTVQPGSEGMAIEYNRITGGYMGINAGPTTSTNISDTTIRGNQLIGPFGEDALRINRYHDSADADPYGILIEGNEITGVRENGNHSDCLQSVWGGDGLYYRRNYLHDNRCQGFFVKDQPETIVGITVEDNLFLRDNEPCAPEAPDCGQPSYFQVFGPYQNFTMRRNTIWQGEVVATFQEGAGSGTSMESNVVNRFWANTNLSGITYANNTRCQRETAAGGAWPTQTPGETVDCSPAFNNPAADDFRLIGSERGVDWAPAEQHYGP
jgi:hypothetical protein